MTEFLRAHEGEVIDMILDDLSTDEWLDLRFEEGLEQGREEGREQIARNLLSEGLPIEVIQRTTGLSTETIQSL